MFDWFANTLRSYPEIAIFLSLAFGYYFGSFTYKGLGLGAVTATLIAAVIIGQLGITISAPGGQERIQDTAGRAGCDARIAAARSTHGGGR